MTSQEICSEIDRVCRWDWEVELAPIAQRLSQADSAATFHILFQFAAHSQDHGPAGPAAWLLRHVNPLCPITCRAAVHEMLRDWDVSIEEVPFYLAEQFGVAAVRAAVEEHRTVSTDRTSATLLGTIEYWLGCYERMQENSRRNAES
jgi:hypothetical protein